jgi:hypothetical protein
VCWPVIWFTATQRRNDDPIISTKTTVNEKVEYKFDIDINYEVKSGKHLVNVKGSLKNHCQFWKNVLNASDYILNVIALGYRIPFVSEPTSVMLRNNLLNYLQKPAPHLHPRILPFVYLQIFLHVLNQVQGVLYPNC